MPRCRNLTLFEKRLFAADASPSLSPHNLDPTSPVQRAIFKAYPARLVLVKYSNPQILYTMRSSGQRLCTLQVSHPSIRRSPHITRTYSTEAPTSPPPRWLSDLPGRIGKCLTFGTSSSQTAEATAILSILARDWRALYAGSQGYLTSGRGLYRQSVVWGDMDSMVRRYSLLSVLDLIH